MRTSTRLDPTTHQPLTGPQLVDQMIRMQPRDAWLMDLLTEHRALTTDQLAALGLAPTPQAAHRRLRALARRGWTGWQRDDRHPDNPTVWYLGPVWTQLALYDRSTPRPELLAGPGMRLLFNPQLPQLLGVNEFFTDLATTHPEEPDEGLAVWWSPRTCRPVIAPDRFHARYGEYHRSGRRIGFWLEYDTGATPVRHLAERIGRYIPLARRVGVATLLYRMASPQREAMLHHHLNHLDHGGLTIATTHAHAGHPATQAWLPAGATYRLPLHHLPDTPPLHHPDEHDWYRPGHRLAPEPVWNPAPAAVHLRAA